MIEASIQYCQERLKITFPDITIKGLFDIREKEENGKTYSFPAGYGQSGDYTQRADLDNEKGLIYFRKNGNLRTESIEDDWNETMERRTQPMRMVLYISKDYYKTDNAYIEDKLYENIRAAITARAVQSLLESTGLQRLEITPSEFIPDAKTVWNEEYKNIPFNVPFDKAYIAVNFDIIAEGTLACFENWGCGDEQEIITFCPIVLNSDGTILVSGAGRSGQITLRDSRITDSQGNLLYSVPATTDQSISDSNVSNSDASYSVNVLSEQSLILPDSEIRDSVGTLLHTLPATQDQVISDSTVKNSAGTTIGTVKAENTVTLADKTLKSSDNGYTSPIVQGLDKTISDVIITRYDGIDMAAQPYRTTLVSTQLARTYAFPVPSQTIQEFRTGDAGWVRNNVFNTLARGYIIPLAAGSFTTLAENNVFGNTNRFTDHLGGQTYAASYAIDHYTGIGWYLTVPGQASWNSQIDAALAFSLVVGANTYDDWYCGWMEAFRTIINSALTNGISYTPFNTIAQTAFRTSSTLPTLTTSAYGMQTNPTGINNPTKSGNDPVLYCRKHF